MQVQMVIGSSSPVKRLCSNGTGVLAQRAQELFIAVCAASGSQEVEQGCCIISAGPAVLRRPLSQLVAGLGKVQVWR